jgi:hypothetical protein
MLWSSPFTDILLLAFLCISSGGHVWQIRSTSVILLIVLLTFCIRVQPTPIGTCVWLVITLVANIWQLNTLLSKRLQNIPPVSRQIMFEHPEFEVMYQKLFQLYFTREEFYYLSCFAHKFEHTYPLAVYQASVTTSNRLSIVTSGTYLRCKPGTSESTKITHLEFLDSVEWFINHKNSKEPVPLPVCFDVHVVCSTDHASGFYWDAAVLTQIMQRKHYADAILGVVSRDIIEKFTSLPERGDPLRPPTVTLLSPMQDLCLVRNKIDFVKYPRLFPCTGSEVKNNDKARSNVDDETRV